MAYAIDGNFCNVSFNLGDDQNDRLLFRSCTFELN